MTNQVDVSLIKPPQPTHTVLGLPLHILDNYTQSLSACITQKLGVHVVTLNAEMAMQAGQDSDLANVIRDAEMVVPDGAGVVFYLRLRGQKIQRCPGIELAEAVIHEASAVKSLTPLFFFGGAPGIAEAAAAKWQQELPDIAIVGVQHGFINADDEESFCQRLKDANPSLILVGLGVPKQEFWISKHRHLCPNAVWMGVGGSFDIWAGTKKRAPKILRENSLEWTYRLYTEPSRWRRMLALPKFMWRAIWER